MRFKEKLALTLRGYRMLHQLVPGAMLWAFVQNLVRALTPFLNVYLSGRIIDFLAQGRPLRDLLWLVGITVTVNALLKLTEQASGRTVDYLIEKLDAVWEKPLYEKIQTMDYARVEDVRTHAALSEIEIMRSTSGFGFMRLYFSFFHGVRGFFLVLFSLTLTIGAFIAQPAREAGGFRFLFSPWFTVLISLATLGHAAFSGLCSYRKTKKSNRIYRSLEPINRQWMYWWRRIRQYQMGKDLKVYALDRLIDSAYIQTTIQDFHAVNGQIQKLLGFYEPLEGALSVAFRIVIYAYVALKALLGAFGVGSIVQYVGGLSQLSSGTVLLIQEISVLISNADALKAYFDFTDAPNQKYQGTLSVEKRADNEYEIEFHDVSFRYPGTETDVLRHVSLKFNIGQKMAVVGRNGSGKTTMIKLLCRLYDPTEGFITLNGIDIRKYDYEDYLGIFSVVFQDFKLFSFSLGQNVAASVSYDAHRVQECLHKAGLEDRMDRMPKGLDTALYKDFDEDGAEISGGEAQKIALARALYKNAPFIILDEPTAALDPLSEFEIYSHFDQIVGDKTAVYISHRLSSCRFCSDILVFDEGSLVQRGSHDQLLADRLGRYYELWHAQAQYYDTAAERKA